jgi:hypothetical protein
MPDTTAIRKKGTTTITALAKLVPQSETHWRSIAARVHRLRKIPGDLAAAQTHDNIIHEIRTNAAAGSSREIRFCPRCLAKGNKYMLLFMGGIDRCGTCTWPDQPTA